MKTAHVIMIAGLTGFVFMSAASTVYAGDNGWSEERMQRKHEMIMKIYDELDLSEEQQAKIKVQRDAMKVQQKELRAQIKEKRAALKGALDKEGADKAEIDRITDELIGLIGQRIRNRVNGIWATKDILNPEQFKMFMEKKKDFKREFKEGHFRRKNHTQGGVS